MSGLEIINWIQSFSSPFLDQVFCAVTDLNSVGVYIVILPLLLWLVDKRFARYALNVLFLSIWSNDVLKNLFDTARPPEGAVRKVCAETAPGGAFPSGHAQITLTFWGALAIYFKRPWFSALVGVTLFLVGFSRLYLGHHWPLDVLGGWAIGLLALWAFERGQAFWSGDGQAFPTRLLWALVIPGAAVVISVIASPGPLLHDTWVALGGYWGAWVGSVIEEEYVGFNPRAGKPVTHLLKVLVGVAVVFAVKEGGKLVLPDSGPGDLIRYALVGLTATLLCPWLFRRFFSSAPPAGRTIAQ